MNFEQRLMWVFENGKNFNLAISNLSWNNAILFNRKILSERVYE